jgi:hypothetical protein
MQLVSIHIYSNKNNKNIIVAEIGSKMGRKALATVVLCFKIELRP